MYYLGIDLGGTNIKGAVVTPEGSIFAEVSRPTQAQRGPDYVAGEIAAVITELSAFCPPGQILGVGAGCPGTIDNESGMVLYSNNLQWERFDLRSALESRTGWRVSLANDANAAALGEAVAGCAQDSESAVILTLGTGVGSGVVLGGKLLTGYTGAAAELGHMVIVDGGRPCTCGRQGCLEAYASATALIHSIHAAMEAHPESLLHQLAREAGGVDGRSAFTAKERGDAVGTQVVEEYIHYLSVGIANIINCFYPEVIALSGGIANQGEALLQPLHQRVYAQIFGGVRPEKRPQITCCTLGYHAGVIGAAMLAR